MRSPLKALRVFTILLAALLVSTSAFAQSTTLQLHEDSELWIDGTSNRSDWTVYASDIEGTIVLSEDGSNARVEQATITVPAGELVSRKSSIMDRLMYGALQVSEHPTVRFVLDDPGAGPSQVDGDSFSLVANGQLTLAGETQDITMEVTGEHLEDGRVRFTGSYPLTMSDYGISPPTAMFGSLRTGDAVVVHFNVVGAPSN
ncbi:MAG: YceI family protein [Bacteroidota bacterium]